MDRKWQCPVKLLPILQLTIIFLIQKLPTCTLTVFDLATLKIPISLVADGDDTTRPHRRGRKMMISNIGFQETRHFLQKNAKKSGL
jgi:hypothetical protein